MRPLTTHPWGFLIHHTVEGGPSPGVGAGPVGSAEGVEEPLDPDLLSLEEGLGLMGGRAGLGCVGRIVQLIFSEQLLCARHPHRCWLTDVASASHSLAGETGL